MGQRYFFTDSQGDRFLPVADAEFIVSGMSAESSIGQCYFQFYDAQKAPISAATAGTVTFTAGAFEGQFLSSSTASVIDATLADYTPAEFDGCVVTTKMALSGITGATYISAFHWRDE